MKVASIRPLLFLLMIAGPLLQACSKYEFELPPAQQQFGQSVTYNNKVDFLLMIDNSSSMLQYQNKFADQVPAMISRITQLGLDFHIGVTTTDMRSTGTGGRLLGSPKFLTPVTPNLVAQLQDLVRAGQTGSDLERGLESTFTLLQPRYLSGEGAGFLRADSLLVIIYLTNEDDYSLGSVNAHEEYLNTLRPIYKGTQRGWIANFIGVESIDGDCQTTPDFKEAGLRYMDLTRRSGGISSSICRASLAEAISNIRARVEQILTDFYLSRRPIETSLRVSLNGRAVTKDSINGWTYEKDLNMIRFHGTAIPGAQDQISVDFDPIEAT
jgi:hypothetical protein